MLQKKSAFDVLMNKNKANSVSPSSSSSSAAAASAGPSNTYSPLKAPPVSDASPSFQKENDPPQCSSSLTKKGRSLALDETITIDSQNSSLVESTKVVVDDGKKKAHSFFQKREKPVKPSPSSDSMIVLDDATDAASSEMYSHPPVHVHQYSDQELEFLAHQLNGSFVETKCKLKPESELAELRPDFLTKLLESVSQKHPFYGLSWNGRPYKQLFPECKCSKNLDIEISQINSSLIYDVNVNFETASLQTEAVKIRKRNFENFKTPSSPKKEEEEEEPSLDDSQASKDASMLDAEGNQSVLDTTTTDESSMPATRSSKRRRTDSTVKPQAVTKASRSRPAKKTAGKPEEPADATTEAKNDVSVVDLLVSLTTKPPAKKCGSEEHELWTEKYQFKNENDIVTNNSQLERLREWLSNWKQILSKESANSNPKKGSKKAGNSGYDSQFSDSDYTYDSDCSNADSMCSTDRVNGRKFYSNAILLTGPHGSGKTSSIYSIAKILGFKVFEVNASSSRCKTQILQELDGALSSHHISSNSSSSKSEKPEPQSIMSKLFGAKKASSEVDNPKNSISSFFGNVDRGGSRENRLDPPLNVEDEDTDEEEADKKAKSKKKKRKISLRKETFLASKSGKKEDSSWSSSSEASSTGAATVNIQKESLILFDEIEVVFKEDVNFWSAVNYFIKKFKKPIILTTTDDYLQDKMNLNIEKIEFIRPRIDSSIRYLKTIARREKLSLETSTAYSILRECKCDMRRALIQLQALVSSSGSEPSMVKVTLAHDEGASDSTINLSKHLDKAIQDRCAFHTESYFDNLIFLDALTKQLKVRYLSWNSTRFMNDECPNSFKRYDMVILRDGLTDGSPVSSSASTTSTTTSGSSNTSAGLQASAIGQLQQQQAVLATLTGAEIDNLLSNLVVDFFIKDDLSFSYSLTYKDQLNEIYKSFVYLFNENRSIDINDWLMHGTVYRFNYPSNTAINKFAQATFKFTSNPALSLDYRPYLQKICHFEELKQQQSGAAFGGILSSRRRFLHYLAHLNLGLVRDDFVLMAKSNFLSILEAQHQQAGSPPSSPGQHPAPASAKKNPLLNNSGSNDALKNLFNGDLFSDDS